MVPAHRIHRIGALCLRDVLRHLRSTQHKQQLRVAIYGVGEPVPSWQRSAFGGQPQDCFFSTTTRPMGSLINGLVINRPRH